MALTRGFTLLDAREMRTHDLDRRDLLAPYARREIDRVEVA